MGKAQDLLEKLEGKREEDYKEKEKEGIVIINEPDDDFSDLNPDEEEDRDEDDV